jgi:hypothetical protein
MSAAGSQSAAETARASLFDSDGRKGRKRPHKKPRIDGDRPRRTDPAHQQSIDISVPSHFD